MNRPFVAALALGAVLIAFGLGATPLLEPDEGRYADIARGFADRGDWVVPRLNGVTFHDKPPLVPWLVGVLFRTIGFGPAVARLVSAAAGWAGLVVAALLVARAGRARWLAVLILLASPLWLAVAKFLSLDATFAALVAGAWALVQRGPRDRVLGGLLLGLAVLAKGPAALVLVVGSAALLAAWERDPLVFARLVVLPVTLALVVAAPWYVAFGLRVPDGLRAFLVEENAARFLGWHEHRHGPHFYFVTALWGHAPLAWLLVAGAGRDVNEPPRTSRPLVAFVVVTLGVFTLASSKVEAYILPASPVLVALLARRIDSGLASAVARPRLVRIAVGWSAVIGVTPLAWLAFGWIGARSSDGHIVAIAASAPVCAALAVLAAPLAVASIAAARKGRATASVACALAASSVALLAAVPVIGTIARWKSVAPVAELLAKTRPDARVVTFLSYIRGLPYYRGEPTTIALSHAELKRATLERERPDLWLPDEEHVIALFRSERALLVVVAKPVLARDARAERFLGLAARAGVNPVLRGEASEFLVYELSR